MSVRFYNTSGWMVGVDLHTFQMAVPPDPLPVPVPCFPHAVAVPLSWGFAGKKSRLEKVTSDGAAMLQKGHKLKMVPHLGLGLPHLLELPQLASVIAMSKSTCVMGVAAVTGGGKPLATCLAGFWGLNLDCSDPVDLPSGQVFNGNTVRTSPSPADYANAAFDIALGNLENIIEMRLPHGSKALRYFKKYKKIKKYTKLAEQVVKPLAEWFGHVLPVPSDIENKINEKREELIRDLLGGDL